MKQENKIVVKFLGIDYRTGKRKHIIHTYLTDKLFEDKHGFLFGTTMPYTNTAAQQAENYIDTLDKTDVIHDNDLMCILDYKVTFCTGMPPKEKKAKEKKHDEATLLVMYFKLIGIKESHMPDLAAAYLKMKDTFKTLNISIEQKATLLLNITNIGMHAYVEGLRFAADKLEGKETSFPPMLTEEKETEEQPFSEKLAIVN